MEAGIGALSLPGEQAGDILKAVRGIGELLKTLPATPDNAAVMYAIMSNLAVIQMNVTGLPRVSSN